MNKILEQNIDALKDKKLGEVLRTYVYNSKPILTTTNGYNVIYNEIHLHSIKNPLAESISVFEQVNNNQNSIHIIYGLGLGYLFQIASKESKGLVVLYEPNLDILHNSFTYVDFTNELSKNNVFLFTDFDRLLNFLQDRIDKETNAEILSLASYRKMYNDTFQEHTKRLELLYGSVILDYGFKSKKIRPVMINILNNIPQLLKETPINKFENLYKDKTAIIVSAGPTHLKNIETLKKYQNNAIIFSVGPAVKTLIKNNIKVDYLCIVESLDCSRQVEGLDLSNINLILEPYTNPKIHALNTKNKLLHVSSNMPPNEYFASIANIDTHNYSTMGTVSYMALNSAVNLGFNKIILVGQDLSYIDGQCYTKDSVYEDLVCKLNPETNKYEIIALDMEKFAYSISSATDSKKRMEVAIRRLKSLNSVLYSVKSIDGKFVPTEAGYASFIQHFENYVKSLEGIEFINTSLKGALIKGFENKSLEEAMADSSAIQKPEIECGVEYDSEKFYKELSSLRLELEKYKSDIEECGKLLSRLTMDCKRNKSVDKDKLLKIRKLIETYTLMDNKVFKFLTVEEDTILSDYLKTVVTYTDRNTPIVVAHLKDYYETIKKHTDYAIRLLADVQRKLRD